MAEEEGLEEVEAAGAAAEENPDRLSRRRQSGGGKRISTPIRSWTIRACQGTRCRMCPCK